MIKKISAILLALVLALSVVVLPVSALEVTGDNTLAFELKWDKEYYKAGDTAVLSVYMKGVEGIQIHSGSLMIGFDSTQLVELAASDVDTVKANWIASDLYADCWKTNAQGAAITFFNAEASVSTTVESKSTAEEAAAYNFYQKLVIARNTGSTIGGNSKAGVPTADINALTDADEPLLQFVYTVAEGVEEGTTLKAGIPSGSCVGTTHTQFKKMKSPGTATTSETLAPATFDISSAVAVAQIGEPAPTYPDFTIGAGKDAIRFEKNADKSYANKVSIRTMAKLDAATLQAAVNATENDAVEAYITEAGFVFAPSTKAFDPAVAKTVAEGTDVDGYEKKNVSYIQNDGTSYNFTCLIEVQDTDIATAEFSTYAFIALDFDQDGTADKYYFSAAKDDISSKALFNAKCEAAWAQYGWGTPTKK